MDSDHHRSGEHGIEPVPPKPDGYLADFDASIMPNVFDIPQRGREVDLRHHRRVDNPGDVLKYRIGDRFVMANVR